VAIEIRNEIEELGEYGVGVICRIATALLKPNQITGSKSHV
jgi:hypothetical protein